MDFSIERRMNCKAIYSRHYEIDSERFPAVVIESDDWLCCERVASPELLDRYAAIMKSSSSGRIIGKLESVSELEAFYQVLRSIRGKDGLSAVVTGFVTMGNPDFERIRQSGFGEYYDISPNDGFPHLWNGTGVIEKERRGIEEGIFYPGYHSLLHHTSPRVWLDLLRSSGPAAERAMQLFDIEAYSQYVHLPEFDGYTARENFAMISIGIERFRKTFGFTPRVAVTSDATTDIELLWSVVGIETVCLKNSRNNAGEVVVNHEKPWNAQDCYAKLGDCSNYLDVTYLTRNAYYETWLGKNGSSPDEPIAAIEKSLRVFGEPAILSAHRINFCSYNPEYMVQRLDGFGRILRRCQELDVFFLTSGELGDLYRKGYSFRKGAGGRTLLRKWSRCEFPSLIRSGNDAESGRTVSINENSLGNFWVETQK